MRDSIGFLSLVALGSVPLVRAAPEPLAHRLLEGIHNHVHGLVNVLNADHDDALEIERVTVAETQTVSEQVPYPYPVYQQAETTTVTLPSGTLVLTETLTLPGSTVHPHPHTLPPSTTPGPIDTPTPTDDSTSTDDSEASSEETPEPTVNFTTVYTCTSAVDDSQPTDEPESDVSGVEQVPFTSQPLPTTTLGPEASSDSDIYPLGGPDLAPYANGRVDPAVLAAVRDAYSADDRLVALLSNGGEDQLVFDFSNPPPEAIDIGDAGSVTLADRSSFPALYDTGVAVALFEMGPCSLVVPHTHSRAAENILVIDGRLHTQFVLDNNLPYVTNDLSKYQSTVFPQGSVHFELNPTCEPASFVSSFSDDDPGISLIAPSLFGFDNGPLVATFGNAPLDGAHIDSIRDIIPVNVVASVERCLQRCNISPSPQKRSVDEVLKKGGPPPIALAPRYAEDEYYSEEDAEYENYEELSDSEYEDAFDSLVPEQTERPAEHAVASKPKRRVSEQYQPNHGNPSRGSRHQRTLRGRPLPNGRRGDRYRHGSIRHRYPHDYIMREIGNVLRELESEDIEITIPAGEMSGARDWTQVATTLEKRDITPWDVRERLHDFISRINNDEDISDDDTDNAETKVPSSDNGTDENEGRISISISRLLDYLTGEDDVANFEDAESEAEEHFEKRDFVNGPPSSLPAVSAAPAVPVAPVVPAAPVAPHVKQVMNGNFQGPPSPFFPINHAPAPPPPPGFNPGPQFQQLPPHMGGPGPMPGFPMNNGPIQGPSFNPEQNLAFPGPRQNFPVPGPVGGPPHQFMQPNMQHGIEDEENPSRLREFLNWIRGNSEENSNNQGMNLPPSMEMSNPQQMMAPPPPYRGRPVYEPSERMNDRPPPPSPERSVRRPSSRNRFDYYEDEYPYEDEDYYYWDDYDFPAPVAPVLEKRSEVTTDDGNTNASPELDSNVDGASEADTSVTDATPEEVVLADPENAAPEFLDVGPVETIAEDFAHEKDAELITETDAKELVKELDELKDLLLKSLKQEADLRKREELPGSVDSALGNVPTVPGYDVDDLADEGTASWLSALWERIFGSYVDDEEAISDSPVVDGGVPTETVVAVPVPVETSPVAIAPVEAAPVVFSTPVPAVPSAGVVDVVAPVETSVPVPALVGVPVESPTAVQLPETKSTGLLGDFPDDISDEDLSWWSFLSDRVDQLRSAVGGGNSDRWAELKKALDEGGLARVQEAVERQGEIRERFERVRQQLGNLDGVAGSAAGLGIA